ncbi:hypothetical protein, partial [Streptococcus oralis]|uniref:hypothetical protein n=1 Tax=Streptococcus oralis TaxID=1303 RepID=UPI001F506546
FVPILLQNYDFYLSTTIDKESKRSGTKIVPPHLEESSPLSQSLQVILNENQRANQKTSHRRSKHRFEIVGRTDDQ